MLENILKRKAGITSKKKCRKIIEEARNNLGLDAGTVWSKDLELECMRIAEHQAQEAPASERDPKNMSLAEFKVRQMNRETNVAGAFNSSLKASKPEKKTPKPKKYCTLESSDDDRAAAPNESRRSFIKTGSVRSLLGRSSDHVRSRSLLSFNTPSRDSVRTLDPAILQQLNDHITAAPSVYEIKSNSASNRTRTFKRTSSEKQLAQDALDMSYSGHRSETGFIHDHIDMSYSGHRSEAGFIHDPHDMSYGSDHLTEIGLILDCPMDMSCSGHLSESRFAHDPLEISCSGHLAETEFADEFADEFAEDLPDLSFSGHDYNNSLVWGDKTSITTEREEECGKIEEFKKVKGDSTSSSNNNNKVVLDFSDAFGEVKSSSHHSPRRRVSDENNSRGHRQSSFGSRGDRVSDENHSRGHRQSSFGSRGDRVNRSSRRNILLEDDNESHAHSKVSRASTKGKITMTPKTPRRTISKETKKDDCDEKTRSPRRKSDNSKESKEQTQNEKIRSPRRKSDNSKESKKEEQTHDEKIRSSVRKSSKESKKEEQKCDEKNRSPVRKSGSGGSSNHRSSSSNKKSNKSGHSNSPRRRSRKSVDSTRSHSHRSSGLMNAPILDFDDDDDKAPSVVDEVDEVDSEDDVWNYASGFNDSFTCNRNLVLEDSTNVFNQSVGDFTTHTTCTTNTKLSELLATNSDNKHSTEKLTQSFSSDCALASDGSTDKEAIEEPHRRTSRESCKLRDFRNTRQSKRLSTRRLGAKTAIAATS